MLANNRWVSAPAPRPRPRGRLWLVTDNSGRVVERFATEPAARRYAWAYGLNVERRAP